MATVAPAGITIPPITGVQRIEANGELECVIALPAHLATRALEFSGSVPGMFVRPLFGDRQEPPTTRMIWVRSALGAAALYDRLSSCAWFGGLFPSKKAGQWGVRVADDKVHPEDVRLAAGDQSPRPQWVIVRGAGQADAFNPGPLLQSTCGEVQEVKPMGGEPRRGWTFRAQVQHPPDKLTTIRMGCSAADPDVTVEAWRPPRRPKPAARIPIGHNLMLSPPPPLPPIPTDEDLGLDTAMADQAPLVVIRADPPPMVGRDELGAAEPKRGRAVGPSAATPTRP